MDAMVRVVLAWAKFHMLEAAVSISVLRSGRTDGSWCISIQQPTGRARQSIDVPNIHQSGNLSRSFFTGGFDESSSWWKDCQRHDCETRSGNPLSFAPSLGKTVEFNLRQRESD